MFLQPGKCLYTTVRELVENSLDAAESIGALPEIEISMYEPARALLRLSLCSFRGKLHMQQLFLYSADRRSVRET